MMEDPPENEGETMASEPDFDLATRAETSATLESLLGQSAREAVLRAGEISPALECCCGRNDCAFLKHNATALDGLEKDVQNAAQLGQALLVRHEAYMVEAEQERLNLGARIEQLESDKQDLQAENAKTVEENRGLLNQLEQLNATVTDSDVHVKSLSATLQSTQVELRRLTGLAARATDLEIQLSNLEQEQTQLQQTLSTTEEHERSAVQRWKSAERTLGDLEDQIERIEKEAREERERHVEILGRLERRRNVERELDGAAGRLKGAALWKKTSGGKDGTNVVSHFVKDILQDNANLQIGVVELREMLLASNEEVEKLREQLVLHQPVPPKREDGSQPASLSKELETEPSTSAPQELHVHHHYHAPEEKAKQKPTIRRPKRKRNVTAPGLYTPPSGMQTPGDSRSHPALPIAAPSTSSAILAQTAVSLPPSTLPSSNNRWSVQSVQTRSSIAQSSVPSSPQSAYRYSSMFDRAFSDNAADSSRPTSPDSVDPSSPVFLPAHAKRGSDTSFRNFKAPTNNLSTIPILPPPSRQLQPTAEENEDCGGVANLDSIADLSLTPTGHDFSMQPGKAVAADEKRPTLQSTNSVSTDQGSSPDDFYAPRLHRSSSHESLLSVSGMDIHLSRDHPSTRFFKDGSFSPTAPMGLSSPSTTTLSSKPVLSSETAFAQRPTMTRRGYDSSTYNRSLLRNNDPAKPQDSTPDANLPLGKRVGGWVLGRWGVKPTASTGNLRAQASVASTPPVPTTAIASLEAKAAPRLRTMHSDLHRPPGVNRSGPVRGLRPAAKAPVSVQTSRIDEELLRESLAE